MRYRFATRSAGAVVAALFLGAEAAHAAPEESWRERLARNGVTLGAANTTDAFVVDGSSAVSNLLEGSVELDLDALLRWPGARAFALVLGTHGEDPAELTGSTHAPSNLAAEDDWRAFELWIEQSFAGQRAAVLAGIYGVDSEFDAKVTAEVFTNGAFGTGLDWSESGSSGPGIFPATGLAIRAQWHATPSVLLRVAAVDGAPSERGELDQDRLDTSGSGAFLIAELDYHRPAAGLSRFALGAWRFTDPQTRLDDDSGAGTASSYGIYGFWEGELYREAGAPGQGLSAFLRAGGSSSNTNPVDRYLGAGLVYTGAVPGRSGDVLGLGLSWGRNSSSLREVTAIDARAESAAELTYLWWWSERVALQPVLQYLRNAGASGNDSWVAGVRARFEF